MKCHLFAIATVLFASSAFAQQPTPVATISAANTAANAKQFDFLLGQWDLDVRPKVSSLVAMIDGTPKLVGTWKAWRAPDGSGVEDEMRIVDTSGNPIALNHWQRVWSSGDARWKVSGADAYHVGKSEATSSLQNGVVHMDGRFVDGNGKTTLTRTRYYDIGHDSFRMQQDRSEDNGQSWDEAVLTVSARRTAATATQ